MGDEVAHIAAAPHELPVVYDDTRVQVLPPDVHYVSGVGIVSSGSVQVRNASDGSSYSVALDATMADPKNPAWNNLTAGPMFRLGGVGLGAMAGMKTGIRPRIDIDGITMTVTPGAGVDVCAGFLCAGRGGAGLIAPEAMLILSGITLLTLALSTDLEDLPALPLAFFAEAVEQINPVHWIRQGASTVGIPLGQGPKAGPLATIEEMAGYRREIDGLFASGNWRDAIDRTTEALASPQDPFVEAELRDLRDRARVVQNERGLPFGAAIEKNIREGVDAAGRFLQTYRPWLADGSGTAPTAAEVGAFMARTLYLARKLKFTFTEEKKKDRIVLKIDTSAPFRITDPELAVRYAEVMAAVFQAMGNEASGLFAFIRAETELRSGALLTELHKGPQNADRILRADARRSWHIGWIQSMGPLYSGSILEKGVLKEEGGFFHRRMRHLGSIVKSRAKGDARRTLLARFDAAVRYSDKNAFREDAKKLASCDVLPPGRYEKIRRGIEALRAAEELSAIAFPGGMGDVTIVGDRERAKGYTRRPLIVDALYRYATLRKILIEKRSPEMDAILRDLETAALGRIENVMERNKAEVRSEWWHLRARGGNRNDVRHWQVCTVRRLEDARDAIEDFPLKKLLKIQKRIGTSPAQAAKLEALILDFRARRAGILSDITALIARARQFRPGGFTTPRELYAREDEDSQAVTAAYQQWDEEVRPAFSRMKAASAEAGPAGDEELKELFEEAEKGLAKAEGHFQKAMADYERFNARRVGAFFLDVTMRQLGIRPVERDGGSIPL